MQNVARNVRPDEVEDDDVLADAIEDLRPRDLELEVAGTPPSSSPWTPILMLAVRQSHAHFE